MNNLAANQTVRPDENQELPIVQKFGGTSMRQLAQVVDIISRTNGPRVAVVSAFAGVTNALGEMGRRAPRQDNWRDPLATFRDIHLSVMRESHINGGDYLEEYLGYLERLAQAVATTRECSPAVRDEIMTLGEVASASFLELALKRAGINAKVVDAAGTWEWDSDDALIYCEDNEYGEGTVDIERSRGAIRTNLEGLLNGGIVPVVTGFRARSQEGRVIALGRGASDYSASIIGAALGARQIQIWTDVDGVMNANPSLVPTARTVEEMTYQEARELAAFGAKVLHPRTLDWPQEADVPVRVLNTKNPNNAGTLIDDRVEGAQLRGVTHKPGFKVLQLTNSKMVGAQGYLARVFALTTKYGISVEDVTTNATGISMSFLDQANIPGNFMKELAEVVTVKEIPQLARISVVGGAINHHPDVAAKIAGVMKKNNWKWTMVEQGSSGVNFTFYADEKSAETIVQALFEELFNDSPGA